MKKLLRKAVADGADYVEFMLHSSELMPGGSPTFPESRHIETLYEDLEALFSAAQRDFEGCTMKGYYQRVVARVGASLNASRPTAVEPRR